MGMDKARHTNGNRTQVNEAAFLRRALAGDQMALEPLFARNNRLLSHTALRLLGNREDAEDALQEGMLAAYRNLWRFEGRSQFST
jgi:RNA polymerase sigma-70 factor (ECF subfamily)